MLTGKEVKAWRLEHGLSQTKMAWQMGYAGSSIIWGYETGRYPMSDSFEGRFLDLKTRYKNPAGNTLAKLDQNKRDLEKLRRERVCQEYVGIKKHKPHTHKVVDREGNIYRFCKTEEEAERYTSVWPNTQVEMTDSYKAKEAAR